MATACSHLGQVQEVGDPGRVCEDCIKTGDKWVHLRQCLTCGHVGCCDSSKNKHATRHFNETDHAVMRSAEPGDHWVWCYVDRQIVGDDRDIAA